jgi:hypothetical protein
MSTTYFVHANSFAAPFVSDESTGYVEGAAPNAALQDFADNYSHPCGLFSADLYESADAYHKGEKPLARWLCNQQIAKDQATAGLAAYSFMSRGPGAFEVDGKLYAVENPQGGRLVDV